MFILSTRRNCGCDESLEDLVGKEAPSLSEPQMSATLFEESKLNSPNRWYLLFRLSDVT